MKPVMLFTIVLLTAIILASAFGLHILPVEPLYAIPPEQAAQGLFVCPSESSLWDTIAKQLALLKEPITMGFFFATMLLVVFWLWAFYQNLLKDKFEKKAYENSWGFTKILFWVFIVYVLLANTPNSYRKVSIDGVEVNYVLCEENTPGAIPVLSSKVKP